VCVFAIGCLMVQPSSDCNADGPERLNRAVAAINQLLQEGKVEVNVMTLKVTVLAQGSGPLPGSTVGIREACEEQDPFVAQTDVAGVALFSKIPAGLYRIEVSFPGYDAGEQWVLLMGAGPEGQMLSRTVKLLESPGQPGLHPATFSSGTECRSLRARGDLHDPVGVDRNA